MHYQRGDTMHEQLLVSSLIIVFSIPMILGKVPRNLFYGFRTSYTMSSDAVWYRANRDAGISLLVAGVIWLGLAVGMPWIMVSMESAARMTQRLGVTALLLAVAAAFWRVHRSR